MEEKGSVIVLPLEPPLAGGLITSEASTLPGPSDD
jgi:hypothetical protein